MATAPNTAPTTNIPDTRAPVNNCGGCAFWVIFAPVGPNIPVARGKCYRFPPILATGYNPATDPSYWVWPVCTADSTCGEWKARV